MLPRALVVLLVVALSAGVADATARAPWRRRRRPDVEVNRAAADRVLPEDWGAEPDSPAAVDRARFAEALHTICGWMPPDRPRRYADWIVGYAAEFDVDAFLLGALVQRMGRCQADAEEMGGLGLTLLAPRMYGDFIRGGVYRYFVLGADGWVEESLSIERFPFGEHRLRRPEENLYFAAALLSVWKRQHATVDAAFEQHPHRHYVSHWVWGDQVVSDRAEDRILTDRRRLLEYYGARAPWPPLARLGLSLGSPLDGAPRVISSWLGDARDDGGRDHRGIDVEAVLGEPVRAVADGVVNFAGVDLPGARANQILGREEIEAVPRDSLGNGGRYVCVLHRPSDGGWLRSCYMHLEDVEVAAGQEVRRGERIGTVGRTGMQTSSPHLHLELHGPEGLLDPAEVFAGTLLGHEPPPPRRTRRR